MMSAEVHVAIRVKDRRGNAGVGENAIEISAAGTMQCVVGKRELGVANLFQIDFRSEILEVCRADFDRFDERVLRLRGECPVRCLERFNLCLLYTSDAADERSSVDLGG